MSFTKFLGWRKLLGANANTDSELMEEGILTVKYQIVWSNPWIKEPVHHAVFPKSAAGEAAAGLVTNIHLMAEL